MLNTASMQGSVQASQLLVAIPRSTRQVEPSQVASFGPIAAKVRGGQAKLAATVAVGGSASRRIMSVERRVCTFWKKDGI